jgi:YidC/Oxa1 family membrane protein insertase
MERGSITKWLLLGFALFLFATYGKKALFGTKASELQPFAGIRDDVAQSAEARPEEQLCTLEGPRYKAVLSSQGGSLRHLYLTDARFNALDGAKLPLDMVTSTTEPRAPLRTDLKLPLVADPKQQQVAFDDLAFKLSGSDGKSCTFTFADEATKVVKTISATDKPYELAVQVDVKNLAPEARRHRFTIEQDSWRTRKDVEGGFMKRQSEFVTDTVARTTAKTERQLPNDFDPGEFSKPEFTAEKWRRAPGEGKLAAVSSVYFTNVVVAEPGASAGAPAAETQIEQRWDRARFPVKEDDPSYGYLYRARLAYPEKELAPGETASYKTRAYAGPKDRDLLAAVDPSAPEVINLGTFTLIAGWLVRYLHAIFGVVKSWGVSIVVLTVTVRLLLFPLSLSQIKSSMAMRKLKPEMDALNEKYKDDAAQRGLAIQELWRKNNVSNPVVGCLPMLLQMPVWWALYSVLQSAVQLYHVPFLWFPDLTAADHLYIIPLVLGASSFFQQKLMPAQGDPQQQKMMLYMMPGVFVFMMLFLPAGLGVYMLTNSVLAIGQQLLVERYLKGNGGGGSPSAQIEVREKSSGDGDRPKPALGKGKASARG